MLILNKIWLIGFVYPKKYDFVLCWILAQNFSRVLESISVFFWKCWYFGFIEILDCFCNNIKLLHLFDLFLPAKGIFSNECCIFYAFIIMYIFRVNDITASHMHFVIMFLFLMFVKRTYFRKLQQFKKYWYFVIILGSSWKQRLWWFSCEFYFYAVCKFIHLWISLFFSECCIFHIFIWCMIL